jgi:N-acetylneuraminic acid mutarotase
VIADTFAGTSNDSVKTFYCSQFFKDDVSRGGESYASTFAQYAQDAMLESWQTQVNTWNLGLPPDADHVHRVFVSDTVNWYHAPPVGGDSTGPAVSDSGPDRQITITHNPWTWNNNYTSDDALVRAFILHEFHHGIQWGLSSGKSVQPTWRWFTEGQARFVQSAQCDSEEFEDTLHYYPRDANKYLTQHMNTSVESLSVNRPQLGYPYCLFWRCMYENFGRDSGGVQLVKNCYAETVGISNSVGRGKAAIDAAIGKYYSGGVGRIGWLSFIDVLDQFAIACYLNVDSSFHKWNPNPPGVYDTAQLTLDSTFRLGPNETDHFVKDDSIPGSYGIDLLQVVLDTNVSMLQVTLARPKGQAVNARLVKIYPPGSATRYTIEPTIGASADSSSFWSKFVFDTRGAERACLVITRQDTLDDSVHSSYRATFKVTRAVAVSDSLPISDTVIAGTTFTPRAVVANRGWMKEMFDATFKVDGTAYSSTVVCTLAAGTTKVVNFTPWTTTEGTFTTACYVYIASDSTRSDDTLRGDLVALADTWQTRPPVPDGVSNGGSLTTVGDTFIYALRGYMSNDFYRYDVKARDWDTMANLPSAATNGASLAWDGRGHVYALRGASGTPVWQFYKYDIGGNAWGSAMSLPAGFGPAGALVRGNGDYIYALQGRVESTFTTTAFFRYDTTDGQWDEMAYLPVACSLGAALCWDLGNYIYAFPAKQTRLFYRYSISGDAWAPKAQTPQSVTIGGALAYDSLDKCVYGWSGATGAFTYFWRYDSAANGWSTRDTPPALVRYGGALASCAGFVYGLRGDLTTDFWRYAPRLSSGRSLRAGVIAELGGTPEVSSFAVSPSPARAPVRLHWQVKKPGPVAVRVFDNTGRVVRTIQNGPQSAGRYDARWDGVCDNGRRAASGVFFYRLDAPGFHKIIKVAAIGK